MTRLPLATALVFMSVAASAQQTTPPPVPALRMPSVQTPQGVIAPPPLPPRAQQAAPPAAAQAPAAASPPNAEAAPAEPPTPAPPLPNIWLPRPFADLVALDKVTARATPLTVRVGQSVVYGSLTISVRACDVRPPDQPADATAFLDITDRHPDQPQFHGWMVVSAPWVSMLQHPIYDVRLAGCHE